MRYLLPSMPLSRLPAPSQGYMLPQTPRTSQRSIHEFARPSSALPSKRRIVIDDDDDDLPLVQAPTDQVHASRPPTVPSPATPSVVAHATAIHPQSTAASATRAPAVHASANGSNANAYATVRLRPEGLPAVTAQASRPPAFHPPATAAIPALAPRAHAAQPQFPSHDQAIIINDDDSGMDLLGGTAQSAPTAHDDSDDNFGVYMLPVRSNNAVTPVHNSRRLDAPLPVQQLAKKNSRGATKASRSRPRASKSSVPRSRERGNRAAVSARAADHLNVKLSHFVHDHQHPNDSDLDEKHQYEGEAEEDNDFIDDGSDEDADDNDDASDEVRVACAALRNRGSWQQTAVSCPLCADLRAVLGHLLGLN